MYNRIKRKASDLIFDIRLLCFDQIAVWRTIPALALKADGRTGYSDYLSLAYRHRLWSPHQHSGTQLSGEVYICLQTGRIVSSSDTSKLASAEHILRLALHPEALDATRIARELRQEAKVPLSVYVQPRDPGELAEIRQALKSLS